MKTIKHCNYRVIVKPGIGARMAGWGDEVICDEIVSQIKRHVDGVHSVWVEHEATPVCGHCGAIWTETDTEYNGGCCNMDTIEPLDNNS